MNNCEVWPDGVQSESSDNRHDAGDRQTPTDSDVTSSTLTITTEEMEAVVDELDDLRQQVRDWGEWSDRIDDEARAQREHCCDDLLLDDAVEHTWWNENFSVREMSQQEIDAERRRQQARVAHQREVEAAAQRQDEHEAELAREAARAKKAAAPQKMTVLQTAAYLAELKARRAEASAVLDEVLAREARELKDEHQKEWRETKEKDAHHALRLRPITGPAMGGMMAARQNAMKAHQERLAARTIPDEGETTAALLSAQGEQP